VIGIQAAIMPGARVGRRVMVAAGSVLTERFETPDGVLVAGVPAMVKKELGGASLDWIGRAASDYMALQARYRARGIGLPPENDD
ncbi:MAG: gamma carbonic anhydrase family protein, partial [Chloroflexota bacterium]